ncbi:9878_t:CDS:2, partial [Cetraspora pellucida]
YISKDKLFYVPLHSNTKQMHNYSNEINDINDQGMIPNLNNDIDDQETISNSSNDIDDQEKIPNSSNEMINDTETINNKSMNYSSKNNPEAEDIIKIFIKEANEDIILNSQIKTALETFIQNYRKARNISTGNLLNFLYQNNKQIRSRKQIPVRAASFQHPQEMQALFEVDFSFNVIPPSPEPPPQIKQIEAPTNGL